MKKIFVLFIIIFNIQKALSCGYYPFGDEVRFGLIKPEMVFKNEINWFHFSSNNYYLNDYDFDPNSQNQYAENCQLWNTYFSNACVEQDIYNALISGTTNDLKQATSNNSFVQALNKQMGKVALNYILFAKQCSMYNKFDQDEWGNQTKNFSKRRIKLIKKASALAAKSKDEVLKRRYAYLAIRLCFYNKDFERLNKIYDTFFSALSYKDAIDYWALHFQMQTEERGPSRDVKAAIVFFNSAEKQFAAHKFFTDYESIENQLPYAKNDQEKLALYFIHGALSNGRALEYITKIEEISPNHPKLKFLLLREINKLEDWVLTPRYANFEPGSQNSYNSLQMEELKAEAADDQRYAADVLVFAEKIGARNPNTWLEIFAIYNQFISNPKKQLQNEILKKLENSAWDQEQLRFLKELLVVNSVACDSDPNLTRNVNQQIVMNSSSRQFFLACAREFELNKHPDLAAAFFEKAGAALGPFCVWKGNSSQRSVGSDYYSDAFFYMDASYSISDIKQVKSGILNAKNTNDFQKWLYADLAKIGTRIDDLIGTKYVRENNWEKALEAFQMVNDSLYTSSRYGYSSFLIYNPFSNDFYRKYDSRHDNEISKKYSKVELAKEMIRLHKVIETETGTKKAQAAYRLANGYRNISYYGNSWLIRRYFWTGNDYETNLEDDKEWFGLESAIKYYEIASQTTDSKRFKALSITLAGKCEEIVINRAEYWSEYSEDAKPRKINKYFKKLKKEYSENYYDLISSCDSYPDFFASGKL